VVSRNQGIRFQGFEVSLGFKESKFRGFYKSWFQGFEVSVFILFLFVIELLRF
jgi:hypothetical protein